MKLFEFKSYLNGSVKFSGKFGSAKLAFEAAVEAKTDLSYVDFWPFRDESFVGARLDGASLVGASLDGASLDGARLDGARLDGARLDGASLDGARLDGARLDGASLRSFKADLWEILAHTPHEAAGLRKALVDGKVNGSTYQGACACLVGTIANVRGCEYTKIPGITPDARRPAEQWFAMIQPKHTPENSLAAKLAVEWIDEWTKCWGAAGVRT